MQPSFTSPQHIVFYGILLLLTFCSLPEVTWKKDTVKQHVTDEMLDEVLDICLTETDTISLLDIPNALVSEDADDAEVVKWVNCSSDWFS